jgi:hypothetical protein
MTLCVIDPESALTVTCVVAGNAGVVACCGVADEEQPVIVVATTSRRAKEGSACKDRSTLQTGERKQPYWADECEGEAGP